MTQKLAAHCAARHPATARGGSVPLRTSYGVLESAAGCLRAVSKLADGACTYIHPLEYVAGFMWMTCLWICFDILKESDITEHRRSRIGATGRVACSSGIDIVALNSSACTRLMRPQSHTCHAPSRLHHNQHRGVSTARTTCRPRVAGCPLAQRRGLAQLPFRVYTFRQRKICTAHSERLIRCCALKAKEDDASGATTAVPWSNLPQCANSAVRTMVFATMPDMILATMNAPKLAHTLEEPHCAGMVHGSGHTAHTPISCQRKQAAGIHEDAHQDNCRLSRSDPVPARTRRATVPDPGVNRVVKRALCSSPPSSRSAVPSNWQPDE